ncbi:MAG: ribosome recycling factor [Thermomicrobiales bacterium]|jgi:ribosome recycling factor|nr:ribosome recycling factor [Thermomicrobiales bacterium]MEA2524434.1 ribosome recycling factor [Thermomicrobiales bacterium]MEA2528784.1 ribosome recycling factor [Thermomicrobiales bacterium]MEA2586815.1 ribosome recycling factor [Thermomicrobiales bacterium]
MIRETMTDAEQRMSKAMEALRRDLNTIRTGRASPSLLDRITIDYYGTPTPLNQVAGISVPEARLLVIQPWDRGTIGLIEKAILKSDLGLNPNNDGQVIRIGIPALTEERRKQLVKQVHNHVEDAKVAVRNIRRDAMTQVRELMNEKMISEDDERRGEHQLDDLTKRFTDEADKVGKTKEHEVMEV